MSNPEIDPQLQFTAQRVAELSGRAEVNLQHQARLREELLRRHQELSAETTQRAAGSLWPRFTRLKRLTLVAPAALAAATVISVLLGALQISNHSTQTAEAARLTRALIRSAPTVTSWRWTVHEDLGNASSAYGCSVYFKPDQRLYIRADQVYRVYLYSYGKWYLVPPGTQKSGCASAEWAFALLPAHLTHGGAIIAPGKPVDGQPTDRISYSVAEPNNAQVRMMAVVEQRTGLVRRLDHVTVHGGKVVERGWAEYDYVREQ